MGKAPSKKKKVDPQKPIACEASSPPSPPLPPVVRQELRRHPDRKVKMPPRSTFAVPRSASEGRVPTKPSPPSAAIRRETISAPAPPIRATETSPQNRSRRRTRITPSLLLGKIQSAPTKSVFQLTEDIATEYSLTPPKKKDVYNQVLMARASRRDFAAQIRRHHSLDSSREVAENFCIG